MYVRIAHGNIGEEHGLAVRTITTLSSYIQSLHYTISQAYCSHGTPSSKQILKQMGYLSPFPGQLWYSKTKNWKFLINCKLTVIVLPCVIYQRNLPRPMIKYTVCFRWSQGKQKNACLCLVNSSPSLPLMELPVSNTKDPSLTVQDNVPTQQVYFYQYRVFTFPWDWMIGQSRLRSLTTNSLTHQTAGMRSKIQVFS